MNAAPEPGRSPGGAPGERWQRALGLVGHGVAGIDTPALVIDLDAMDRNIARMVAFAQEHGLRLRPHAKTHKSAELANLQMAAGAVGVCVQKTDEALALARAGVRDVYISNQVIAPAKLQRLAHGVRDLPTRFAIAVDSAIGVDRLATALADAGVRQPGAVDVFVEIDVGHGRCGVAPGEAALALARLVASHSALRLAGLQAYHGSAQHQRSPAKRSASLKQATEAVRDTLTLLRAHGLDAPLVTGAGTGTFVLEAASGLWGELQAGSYLFMDADYAANQTLPGAPAFEHALFIRAQVMSRGTRHAVCDAGHKSHAIDSGLPTVAWPPGLVYANGGDEHGILTTATAADALPALGDTVWLVPGHCDPTVNLHDFYIGVRGGVQDGRVERVIAVDARGALG
ncbi:MAG: DSD1 family PLP-dependent enzyme [Hydrogenophaga sp.]|nr:DSD1 family PLP-dependent enzyme [Hydrogenophaga sp.]